MSKSTVGEHDTIYIMVFTLYNDLSVTVTETSERNS